jgi:predicted NUDIX family phosphoesterase
MSKIAHIIAIRAASIAGWAGLGFGIRPVDEAGETAIFDNGEVWVGPREVLETNPEFVQPIPYIVVKNGDKLLSYLRTPKGGEARLHSKIAVGFGGHVDLKDATLNGDLMIDLRATMATAALREMSEELGITLSSEILEKHPDLLKYTHIIHSQESPVDEVHIAFVVTIDLSVLPSDEFNFEDAIGDVKQMTAAELRAAHDLTGDDRLEMENWARFVVDQILSDAEPVAA